MSMFEETTMPVDEHDILRPAAVEDSFAITFPPNVPPLAKTYEIGDLFCDGVYLGVGSFYRAWHVRVSDERMGRREFCTKIGVRYHMAYPDGFLLIIDGKLRFMYNPSLSNIECPIVSFTFNGVEFEITAKTNVASIDFNLLTNGSLAKEVKEVPDIALDELRPGHIMINDVRVANDGKKPTVYYRLSFALSGTGQSVEIERRYSEFVALDEIVRGHLSAHLRTTLPSLPGRVLNPFVNQASEKFIQDRKVALQQYLVNLQGNSKASLLTEFYCFLGLHPVTGAPLRS